MLCRDTELVPGGEFTFGVKDGADSMPGYNRHETFILFSSFRQIRFYRWPTSLDRQ